MKNFRQNAQNDNQIKPDILKDNVAWHFLINDDKFPDVDPPWLKQEGDIIGLS